MMNPRAFFRTSVSVILGLLLVSLVPISAKSDERNVGKPQIQQATDHSQISAPSTVPVESPQVLAGRIDDLNHRLDSELKASDDRYEALLHTTERDFHAIEAVVVLGSLFVGIVVGWATYREVQQRGTERAFYETQAKKAEEREEETHSYAIRFAEQQVSRSGEVLSEQIENMNKLGKVIDLMNKTFDKQLTTLNQLDQFKLEITKLQALWTNVAGDYEKKI